MGANADRAVAPSVHQLVPNLAFGDAISQQALTLRAVLRSLGCRSEIYSQHVDVRLRGEARPFVQLRDAEGDRCHVVFHFSLGSEVTDYYRCLPNPRTIVYHNITPPEFFRGVNERVASLCARGREELASLRPTCRLALGASEFNRQELTALGFQTIGTLPYVVDPVRYEQRPVRRLGHEYGDGWTNLLHVGRLVPNKRLEDVIKVFWFFRRKINPKSRLILVGIDTDMEIYSFALQNLVRDLDLQGVVFAGQATERELATYYRLAHAYVCMSEHEGFCVPLIEAMHFGVPVIAYAAAAIPETVGDAGALVFEKRFPEIAELVALACEEGNLRRSLVEAGRERARAFQPDAIRPRVQRLLETAWGDGA